MEEILAGLKRKIKSIYDFPKPGMHFRDITPLLRDSDAFKKTIELLSDHYKNKKIDVVIAVEPRGFIVGATLAMALGVGFVPLRRKGKTNMTIGKEYGLDYKINIFEMPENAVKKGEKVLFFDDVLAGGKTAETAINLIEKTGCEVAGLAFLIELEKLNARKKLKKYNIHSLIKYEDR